MEPQVIRSEQEDLLCLKNVGHLLELAVLDDGLGKVRLGADEVGSLIETLTNWLFEKGQEAAASGTPEEVKR